jgi:hypothetical protein
VGAGFNANGGHAEKPVDELDSASITAHLRGGQRSCGWAVITIKRFREAAGAKSLKQAPT